MCRMMYKVYVLVTLEWEHKVNKYIKTAQTQQMMCETEKMHTKCQYLRILSERVVYTHEVTSIHLP